MIIYYVIIPFTVKITPKVSYPISNKSMLIVVITFLPIPMIVVVTRKPKL